MKEVEFKYGHTLYSSTKMEAPASIKDEHGSIVLDMCVRCKRAEGDLDEMCPGFVREADETVSSHLVAPYTPSLPDIGLPPHSRPRSEYRGEAAMDRLRAAYVAQQEGVPNQSALVWRADIGYVFMELTRIQAWQRLMDGEGSDEKRGIQLGKRWEQVFEDIAKAIFQEYVEHGLIDQDVLADVFENGQHPVVESTAEIMVFGTKLP